MADQLLCLLKLLVLEGLYLLLNTVLVGVLAPTLAQRRAVMTSLPMQHFLLLANISPAWHSRRSRVFGVWSHFADVILILVLIRLLLRLE